MKIAIVGDESFDAPRKLYDVLRMNKEPKMTIHTDIVEGRGRECITEAATLLEIPVTHYFGDKLYDSHVFDLVISLNIPPHDKFLEMQTSHVHIWENR